MEDIYGEKKEEFFKAILASDYEKVREILSDPDKRAILNMPIHPLNDQEWTALHWAADRGDCAMVNILVEEFDADPDPKDIDGLTPLMTAATQGFTEICKILVNSIVCDY